MGCGNKAIDQILEETTLILRARTLSIGSLLDFLTSSAEC